MKAGEPGIREIDGLSDMHGACKPPIAAAEQPFGCDSRVLNQETAIMIFRTSRSPL